MSIDNFRLNCSRKWIFLWNNGLIRSHTFRCRNLQITTVNFSRFTDNNCEFCEKYAVDQNSDGSRLLEVYNTFQWVLTQLASKNRPNSFLSWILSELVMIFDKMSLVYFLLLLWSTLIEMCCRPLDPSEFGYTAYFFHQNLGKFTLCCVWHDKFEIWQSSYQTIEFWTFIEANSWSKKSILKIFTPNESGASGDSEYSNHSTFYFWQLQNDHSFSESMRHIISHMLFY